jgi:hypothetical protein
MAIQQRERRKPGRRGKGERTQATIRFPTPLYSDLKLGAGEAGWPEFSDYVVALCAAARGRRQAGPHGRPTSKRDAGLCRRLTADSRPTRFVRRPPHAGAAYGKARCAGTQAHARIPARLSPGPAAVVVKAREWRAGRLVGLGRMRVRR